MVEKVFLTENRRDILNGKTDLEDNSLAVAKSRIRTRARTALDELLTVAASPEIDNADIFEPEDMEILLKTLLTGRGGLVGDDVPADLEAWHPPKEYRNEMYVAIDQVLRDLESDAENSDLYQMLGGKAESVRTDDQPED